ncbi:MAG: preprotein translocase subunit Sec61beta [Desulfurococcaceae archaeon]
MSRKSRRSQSPSVASAAGLVRFFEEADLKIALKPHLIILLGAVFVTIVIILSKMLPPSF